MTDDDNRTTDYLAVCRLSYGIGAYENVAVMNALRYAGPFEDEDEPIEVAVWHLYADSWSSHSLRGPERGADQLSFTLYEIEPEIATESSVAASEAFARTDDALGMAEVAEKTEFEDEDDDSDDGD